jgi:carboxypeptidase family protein/TonB-dependent receptor-like protein
MRVKLMVATWLVIAALGAEALCGQQPGTATLSGRVMDANGAVVVGAKVAITLKATNTRRETKTNEDGLFVVTSLAPGDYEVRVQQAGFKTTVLAAIPLRVGQNENVAVTLEVGELNATLEGGLFDSAPLVDTVSSVVNRVVERREIESLPLNGRNFLELALQVPGNAPAPNFDPTKTSTVLISSAGQLGRGSNVTIDGGDNNDDVVGGSLINVSQDSVQEFQIATNRFSAQLGRSGSSVINIVTKAGTNALHGSGAFFYRDRNLQALPATFDRFNPDPPFDREQYSATLGGPLVKDKAFWFGAFEYRNQGGAVLVGERDAATRSIRQGFAPAPLNDLLGTARGDWFVNDQNKLTLRYAIERADDTGPSTLIRAIGSASERQASRNHYQSFLSTWTDVINPTVLNAFSFSVTNFINKTEPVTTGPQLTFPSLQDGASFRVPQQTRMNRLQFAESLQFVKGRHGVNLGAEYQRIDADFNLGVFQQGRIEFVQDFPAFDANGDGRVDDNDLLFAVTLRSATPTRPLIIPNADNNHVAFFIQDDWHVRPNLTLNLGLRYELDTDVKNISHLSDLNPIILPFLSGKRERDRNNFGPRVGFNWSPNQHTSVHGGYGIYYDRVILEISSLERGLDGRSLAIEVRAGNVFFLNPMGQLPPGAPSLANPFTGFILPGAGAGGINIIDNKLQNPMVQQTNLGIEQQIGRDFVLRADFLHDFGTHFIIGRTIGTVFNPVVGGPDRVVNLESSVQTKYDGLLVSFEKRLAHHYQMRASYTLSKAFNYANDDQIPFAAGPIDSNNLQLEYGPGPNDQRHRFTFSGVFELPYGFKLAPIWTLASAVPMDILLPDASTRIPSLQRNAGGRLFHNASELNEFIQRTNASGGVGGQLLPLVSSSARFNDRFDSLDLRFSRIWKLGEATLEPAIEVFNVFNVTNVLGVSNVNYSGFANVLVRDSDDPKSPGFLKSSSFGHAVTTAGGVFGSGGPRAFQLAVKVIF